MRENPNDNLTKSTVAAAPRVSFVSLGCPKALVDSERIITRLRAEGYEFSRGHAGADVVVVNTCGFLDSAKAESLEAIGAALGRKRQGGGDRLHGRGARKHIGEISRRVGGHATAGLRERPRGRARGGSRAARPLPRSRPGAGRQAHAASLRLSQNLGGLRQQLLLLHHSASARAFALALGGGEFYARPKNWCARA